jgi:hypothetical protein
MQRFETSSQFYRDFNLGVSFHQFTSEPFGENLDSVLSSRVHHQSVGHGMLGHTMAIDTATDTGQGSDSTAVTFLLTGLLTD